MNKSPSDVSKHIELFVENQEKKLGAQFSELCKELSPHLTQWDKWFEPVFLPSSWKKYLSAQTNVQASGEQGRVLIEYGLTPAGIFSAFHGLDLLFSLHEAHTPKTQQPTGNLINSCTQGSTPPLEQQASVDAPYTSVEAPYAPVDVTFKLSNDSIALSWEEVSFEMGHSSVPQENHINLAKWCLEVLKLKPDMLSKFHVLYDASNEGQDVFTVTKKPPSPLVANEQQPHSLPEQSLQSVSYSQDTSGNYLQAPPMIEQLKDWTDEKIVVPAYAVGMFAYMAWTYATAPLFMAAYQVRYHIEKSWWNATRKNVN